MFFGTAKVLKIIENAKYPDDKIITTITEDS
jgi:hypothetical protein